MVTRWHPLGHQWIRGVARACRPTMWAPIPSETITFHSSMGPIQEIGRTSTALQVGANALTVGGLFLGDWPQAHVPIGWLASLTGLQSPPATDLALETCWLVLTCQVSVDGGGIPCVAVSPPGKTERLRQILSKYLS